MQGRFQNANPGRRFPIMRTLPSALGCALGCALSHGAPPPSTALTLTPDRSFVVDKTAALVWPRCVHGQTWAQSLCTGVAAKATYREASQLAAQTVAAEGFSCRLPSAAELQLVLKKIPASDNNFLLPGTVGAWYWTRSNGIDSTSVNQYTYSNIQAGRTAENVTRLDAFHMLAVQWPQGAVRSDLTKATRLSFRVVCTPKE